MSASTEEFRFCPVCGDGLHALQLKENESRRLVCDACDFVFYLDPKVVACTLVEKDDRIVLLKRAIEPQKGLWVIPGGYVDRREEVETAALREAVEECGLSLRLKELLGVYSYSGYVPVVIVYLADVLGGTLVAGDETAEAGWFARDEIPWEKLAFRSTTDALKDYYDHHPQTHR